MEIDDQQSQPTLVPCQVQEMKGWRLVVEGIEPSANLGSRKMRPKLEYLRAVGLVKEC